MPRPQASTFSLGKIAVLLFLAAAIIGGVGFGSKLLGNLDNADAPEFSTYTAEKTELLVTVTEDGNVESAVNVEIKCKVAGGSSILSIVPDGEEVKAGDKLVELDSSTIEDSVNTQMIAFSKAKSTVIQAEKDYEVAQISVKEYLEGTFVQELEVAETNITIAEENLRSAKNALEYSEKMFQRGYISELELESQQFAVKRAQLELNSANTTKKVLEKFTKVKMLEDLKSQVETAKATMESEQAAFELEESKLERLKTQLENCTIYAPQDGMVVYANERGGRFGQQSSTIEEGAAVRDQQTILRLPDLSQMQVKVKVHETKVEQIEPDMRARINIQGRELVGHVVSVANQPEQTSFFQGNVKEYATIVKIDGQQEALKPGMTAEVEILIAHLQDVLAVPVSCVMEQRGGYYCWVYENGAPQRREVKLGLTNDQFVEIKQGINEGDRVIRNPRAFASESESDSTEEKKLDVTKKFGDAPRRRMAPDGPGRMEGPGDRRPSRDGERGMSDRRPGGRERGDQPGGQGQGSRIDLMQFDSDGDGKVSKDEAPERMKQFFDRMDGNADGFIDKAEVDEMRSRFRQGGPPRGDRGGERRQQDSDQNDP